MLLRMFAFVACVAAIASIGVYGYVAASDPVATVWALACVFFVVGLVGLWAIGKAHTKHGYVTRVV